MCRSLIYEQHQKFKSRVEEVKNYIEKHGHMNITKEENRQLHGWISAVKYSYRKLQKGKPYAGIRLTPDRIDMLRQTGFAFLEEEYKTKINVSFESRIEALKHYQAKHGHVNVSKKEDISLWRFVSKVRQSAKRIQEGKTARMKLTPNRITALEEIGFNCRRPKRGRTCALIPEIPSTSCNSFKRQRVEESFHDNHEEIPISRTFTPANENEDMEEIEGDIVPMWLISDEKEEDNDDSLLDEISIKIDDGTEVHCSSTSTPVPDTCRSS